MGINTIQEARKIYEQRLGRQSLLEEQKNELAQQLTKTKAELERTRQAHAVVQQVAGTTQKKIEFHISNLVTMALASVFPEPYEFQLRFVERRNSMETDLIFLKGENEINDILSFGGGGVADVSNFALILSLWALKKTRPTFILDEPDKFLHNQEYQSKASAMMKMLCQELGIQIIIVSDQDGIKDAADNVITIEMKNGVSLIKEN